MKLTYSVADLIPRTKSKIAVPPPGFGLDEMQRVADLITSAIAPMTWSVEPDWIDDNGMRCGYLKTNPVDGSVTITHSEEVHAKIAEYLATLRRLRDSDGKASTRLSWISTREERVESRRSYGPTTT